MSSTATSPLRPPSQVAVTRYSCEVVIGCLLPDQASYVGPSTAVTSITNICDRSHASYLTRQQSGTKPFQLLVSPDLVLFRRKPGRVAAITRVRDFGHSLPADGR